jgi:hypothetical protein
MPLSMQASVRKDKNSGKNATMTHQHFAFIAAVLASTRPKDLHHLTGEYKHWSDTVKVFADELAKTNPRFDLGRFLTAANF